MHNSLCALFTVSDIWAEVNIRKNGENCGKPQNEGKIRIFILSSARSKMLVQPTYFFVFSFLVPKQYLRIIGCMCTCYCRAEFGRNWSKKMKKGRKNRDFSLFWKYVHFQEAVFRPETILKIKRPIGDQMSKMVRSTHSDYFEAFSGRFEPGRSE